MKKMPGINLVVSIAGAVWALWLLPKAVDSDAVRGILAIVAVSLILRAVKYWILLGEAMREKDER